MSHNRENESLKMEENIRNSGAEKESQSQEINNSCVVTNDMLLAALNRMEKNLRADFGTEIKKIHSELERNYESRNTEIRNTEKQAQETIDESCKNKDEIIGLNLNIERMAENPENEMGNGEFQQDGEQQFKQEEQQMIGEKGEVTNESDVGGDAAPADSGIAEAPRRDYDRKLLVGGLSWETSVKEGNTDQNEENEIEDEKGLKQKNLSKRDDCERNCQYETEKNCVKERHSKGYIYNINCGSREENNDKLFLEIAENIEGLSKEERNEFLHMLKKNREVFSSRPGKTKVFDGWQRKNWKTRRKSIQNTRDSMGGRDLLSESH